MVSKAAAKKGALSSVEIINENKCEIKGKRRIKVQEEDEQSEEEEPLAKKTKLDYKQHPVHWAPDGNVLIHISGTRFKLYRHHLVAQSQWFKILFEAQQTGVIGKTPNENVKQEIQSALDSLEIVDGCNLFKIEINEIDDEDVAALLDAMEDAM